MHIKTDQGIKVWAERRGHGPRLLVLTGTYADLRKSPTPFDSPLGRGFDVLTFDQRGLGRTDKPPGPYSIAAYAQDAYAVMQAYNWSCAHVIGISFGGMVAQELALRFPQTVTRLVLCCTAAGGASGGAYPLSPLRELDAEARARHLAGIYDTRCDAIWARENPEAYEKLIAAAVIDPYTDKIEATAARAAQLAARDTHDAWSRLNEIQAETLVCGGAYDGVAPPDLQARMATRIGADLRLYEGGHFFLKQDKRAYADIATFLHSGKEALI